MGAETDGCVSAASQQAKCVLLSRRDVIDKVAALTFGAAGAAILAACSATTPAANTVGRSSSALSTGTSSSPTTSSASVTSASVTSSSQAASSLIATTASSNAATTAAATTPASTSSAAAHAANANIPTYVPLSAVQPDLPGTAAGVPAGYLKLPASYAAYSGTPGKGGNLSFFTIDYTPPVRPLAGNTFWQELNKKLGVNLQVDLVPASGYQDKFAALTASGSIPDMVVFPVFQPVPHLNSLLEHEFVNLTSYLAGDKVKSYPNLANLDTYAWRNSMVNNQIWGMPISRSIAGGGLLFRDDWAKAQSLALPQNADDFFKILKAFTDPTKSRWGMAAVQNGTFNVGYFLQMYRGPNNWRLNPDKTLTNAIEAPEYEQAVAYAVKVFKAGCYYPGSANLSILQAKQLFAASKVGCYTDGITASPQMWMDFKSADPTHTFTLLQPFGYDGGKAAYALGSGLFSYTAVSKKAASRVQEILSIFDYCAAPFGSAQWQFLSFGIEGHDWKPGPNGARIPTKTGQRELLPTGYIGAPPYYLYDSEYPEVTKIMYEFSKKAVPQGVNDPTIGLYSATAASKSASLARLVNDRVVSIVSGRSPITALKTLVSDWKSQGGDQMRKEYEAALGK